MSTQTHILTIKNSEIIYQVEARTFKFGKARDNGQADKLINNVKLTDLDYDRSMVYMWIRIAINNIYMVFKKYACRMEQSYESEETSSTGSENAVVSEQSDDNLVTTIYFVLSSRWPSNNGAGFDLDCKEYIINKVISEFLSLSLPREAEIYAAKAMQALKDAERKLYFKNSVTNCDPCQTQ